MGLMGGTFMEAKRDHASADDLDAAKVALSVLCTICAYCGKLEYADGAFWFRGDTRWYRISEDELRRAVVVKYGIAAGGRGFDAVYDAMLEILYSGPAEVDRRVSAGHVLALISRKEGGAMIVYKDGELWARSPHRCKAVTLRWATRRACGGNVSDEEIYRIEDEMRRIVCDPYGLYGLEGAAESDGRVYAAIVNRVASDD